MLGQFLGNSVYEGLQGLHVIPGTFDTGDFVAYAAGSILFLGMTQILKARERRMYL